MTPLHLIEARPPAEHLAGDISADRYWNVGLASLSPIRKVSVGPSVETQRSCPLSRIAVLKALRPPPASLRFAGRLAIMLGLLTVKGLASAPDQISTPTLGRGDGGFRARLDARQFHCGGTKTPSVDDLRLDRTSADVRRGSFLTSISCAPNGAVSLSGAGVPTIYRFGKGSIWTLAERQTTGNAGLAPRAVQRDCSCIWKPETGRQPSVL